MGARVYHRSSRLTRLLTERFGVCDHVQDNHCSLASLVEEDEVLLRNALQDGSYDVVNLDCPCHALQAASLENQQTTAELLLARGADANFTGGFYETALQAAIMSGHVQMVERLLQHGARTDTETAMLSTPLQAAANWGHKEIVLTLLEYGADVNQQAGSYNTALQVASVEGHTAIIEVLLDHGADVNIYGGVYGTALRAAASICGITVPPTLIRGELSFDSRLYHPRTRLQTTTLLPRLKVVAMLLRATQEGYLA